MDLDELAADAAKQYRTTPTMVADILREAILAGALKGGQPLRQEDLATKFRLSRGPVREALRQLEGEGLITFSPHRGAVVSELSLAEVQEICDIRIALETAALRFAIPHLSEDVLKRAEEILDEADQQTTEISCNALRSGKSSAPLISDQSPARSNGSLRARPLFSHELQAASSTRTLANPRRV